VSWEPQTFTLTESQFASRFAFVICGVALLLPAWPSLLCGQAQKAAVSQTKPRRIPIIDVTDLYQPFQDPGEPDL